MGQYLYFYDEERELIYKLACNAPRDEWGKNEVSTKLESAQIKQHNKLDNYTSLEMGLDYSQMTT